MSAQVLVVGAGPTGMTLALQLRAHGAPVRLVERAEVPREGSKALSVNPSTLYAFDALGVGARVVRRGRLLSRAVVVHHGRRLAAADLRRLPYRHNHFVMLPQPETEVILRARLEEVGVSIERGVALVDLVETPAGVVATTEGPGGVERRSYSDVVGCDGGRSTVRNALGVEFRGVDYPMHFLMADARLEGAWRRDEGQYLVEGAGFLIVLPLDEHHHRVVVKVDGPFDDRRRVSFDDVVGAVRACVGDRLRLRDPIWISGAPFYNRLAASMQRGRVFLAGDAAHLFSPIGGFGMNTGVGDAVNLGWRLAYVQRGHAAQALLAGYERERLGLARRLVALTDQSTSLLAGLDRHGAAAEGAWLPLARNRPNLRALPYNLAGFAHSYEPAPSGRAGRALLPGCVLPFLDAVDLPCGHLVIARPPPAASVAWVERLLAVCRPYDAFLRVVVFSDGPAPSAPKVQWRTDVAALEATGFREGLVLLRPDLYVERVSVGVRACEELAEHLGQLYLADARAEQPARATSGEDAA